MSARLADDELLITRTFDAPASVVFSLWSSPKHMKRWMGPQEFTCPEAEIDFRVGGAYRAMINPPSTAKTGSAACIARSFLTGGSSSLSRGTTRARPQASRRSSRSISKSATAGRSRSSTRDPSGASSAATASRWLERGFRQARHLRQENRKGAQRMITISAFKWVPEFAQGQVRDLRARWALEEAGLPLQDAPSRKGRSGQSGVSRAAALRAGADPRRRRLRPLRIRSHRALCR